MDKKREISPSGGNAAVFYSGGAAGAAGFYDFTRIMDHYSGAGCADHRLFCGGRYRCGVY